MAASVIYHKEYKSFAIGSSVKLSRETLEKLIGIFEFQPSNSDDFFNDSMEFNDSRGQGNIDSDFNGKKPVLGGRGTVKSIYVPEAGNVIIKQYKRGGLISCFNKRTYLKFRGQTRAEKEFEMLFMAEKAGVNVPFPLAYVSRGNLFYRAWLVTKEINQCQNFAEIAVQNKKRAMKIFPEISLNIKKLIRNRIYHVDLHPGNVLIDADDKNYIIDFDKAFYFKGSIRKLSRFYRKRWSRAVVKYDLPDFMSNLGLGSKIL